MNYVLIDTNIYCKEKFNVSCGFFSFLEKTKDVNDIGLLYSPIIINEIYTHIDETVNDFHKKYKDAKTSIAALSNERDYQYFFNLNEDNIKNFLKEKIDKYLNKFKLKELALNTCQISEIMNDYFQRKPPFGNSNKKYEFPDAFILNSLLSMNFNDNDNILILSEDNDWNKFFSDKNTFKFFSSGFELLKYLTPEDEFASFYNEKIENWCDKHFNEIIDLLNRSLNIDFHIKNDDDEIIDNNSTIINFDQVNCIYKDEKYGSLDFDVSIYTNVDISIEFPDYDNAYWDREDNSYYNLENKIYKYTGEIQGIAVISLDVEFLSEGNIKIKKLNTVELLQHEIENNINELDIEDLTNYDNEY